ncbi:MAG: type II secretion system protein [bacterium]|nr:type II secretion system protein [bacterium]
MKAFTLAEVLITLAIIGVVAAVSIPSVISNSQQQEFKTGLRKAVSVLNSAITTSLALDGESPYDNRDLFRYLQRHMSVMKTVVQLPWYGKYEGWDGSIYDGGLNGAFYTTDGMRFEFDDIRDADQNIDGGLKLHESNNHACFASVNSADYTNKDSGKEYISCGGCGSLGLEHNLNETTKPPCAILVDVNGDRKPTPKSLTGTQKYWVPTLDSNRVSDIFVVLITEDRAIPYGVVAQRAMYQAQK